MGERTMLIVDDSAAFRSRARRLFEAEGFHVVGEAEDATSALDVARSLHPQVVLLDVVLPDMTGFDVCDRLVRENPAAAVVMTSSRDVGTYRRRLAGSLARGFIEKSRLSGPAVSTLLG